MRLIALAVTLCLGLAPLQAATHNGARIIHVKKKGGRKAPKHKGAKAHARVN